MAFRFPDKDPDEKLDYTVDWSRYLERDSLTIADVTWKIEKEDGTAIDFDIGFSFEDDALVTNSASTTGLTCSNIPSPTDTTTTIVLEKGIANLTYILICQITTTVSAKTTAPIITDRKIKLRVRERT